jgi:hypothetical protein
MKLIISQSRRPVSSTKGLYLQSGTNLLMHRHVVKVLPKQLVELPKHRPKLHVSPNYSDHHSS